MACIIINISNSHAIPYVVPAISNEIPIAIESALAEADTFDTLIKKNVSNLYEMIFLHRYSAHAKGFKPYIIKDKPSNLSYFRFQ